MATIVLTNESGTPATPSAGVTKVYARDGVLHILDSSGTPRSVDSSGITAGPTGSGATFTGSTALTDAIAAAMAVAPATVGILPGSYTGDITLPAGVSLVAAFGTMELAGSIALNATTSSMQTLSGLVFGNLILDAGGTSSATVIVNQCEIHGNNVIPGVTIADDGWEVVFISCLVDGDTRKGVTAANANLKGTSTLFKSNGDHAIETQGSVDLHQCSLRGGVSLGGTASAELTDTNVAMPGGAAAAVFTLGGTSDLSLMGGFSVTGVDPATGTLWTGSGTFTATSGTFLGSYNSAHLPTVDAGAEGCIAYAWDMQSLAVVASGSWEPVGGGGGGGIPDPGGETPGAMLYYRDPGGGGDWDLIQHTREGAALKFSLYENNGSPYWDFPAPPKNFTLFYEGAATAGVDASNVPEGTSPGTIPSWLGSKAGGTPTGLTTVVGTPNLNNGSVEFGNGDSVSGTPTLLELPAGASARTVVVVFSNAMMVTGPTPIVAYGSGGASLDLFVIGVLDNGNLGWWCGGTGQAGGPYSVDFGIPAASGYRRMLIVTYNGTNLYWTLNANEGAWSAPAPFALNTGFGAATPLVIGGASASYSVEAVIVFNTAMNNDLSSIQQLQAYASSLRMSPGTTMTFPGGEYGYGTLFYANSGGPAGLIALPSSVPGRVLTVGTYGAPEWAAASGGGLTNGTWAARPATPTTGQQYLVADEGGFAHGDLYTAAQPNRWDITSYRRVYYPHSPTRRWEMTYTITGPAFINSGSLGGQDLAITGGFITGLPGGFNSIASRRTSFTGAAHANGGTAPLSTANVSLAIWYKPTAATGAVVPLLACTNSDTGPSTGIGIWQDITIGSVIAKVNGLSSTFAVPSELINQDNLLVLVYNQANAGAELTLYANGLAIGSINTTAAAINWFGCTWMIGNDGTALPVSGELCQAAAWDGTTLSSMEVQQIYERGVGTYTGS